MIMDFGRANRAKLQSANDDTRQEAQRIMLDIYSGHVAQECRKEDLEKNLLFPAMLPQREDAVPEPGVELSEGCFELK
ncbi:unnamed protein product, partial [Ectocarpus sp. 13 AM-2016]